MISWLVQQTGRELEGASGASVGVILFAPLRVRLRSASVAV